MRNPTLLHEKCRPSILSSIFTTTYGEVCTVQLQRLLDYILLILLLFEVAVRVRDLSK